MLRARVNSHLISTKHPLFLWYLAIVSIGWDLLEDSVMTPAHSYSYLVQAQSLLRLSDSYRHVSGQGSIPTEELADSGENRTKTKLKIVCIAQAAIRVQC
jgi:hypothetical protein